MSETKHSTLLPCPFCGGPAGFFENEIDFVPWPYVQCEDCDAMIDACEGDNKSAMAERWNTRAATSLHHELVSALESVVNNIEDYERVNNLSPSPGRTECWDSVTKAKAVLAKAKPLNLEEPRG